MLTIGVVIIAFLATIVFVPLVRRLAFALGAVDAPSARKVHAQPMPRLGGLAMIMGFWLVIFTLIAEFHGEIGFFIGGMLLLAIGIYDDCYDMPPKIKLLGQILAAFIVSLGGIRIVSFTNWLNDEGGQIVLSPWVGIPLTVIWIVAIINAVNLIDGLDGLAAGISGIAALTLGIVAMGEGMTAQAHMAFALLGCSLGFLIYNFHPASIFMGDTGSMFLGYALAVISLMGTAKGVTFVSLFTPILVLGIPIFDTLFAIVRRAGEKKPIFQADKAHLHHQLLSRGFTHRSTVLFIYALAAGLSVGAIILNHITTEKGFLLVLMLSTVLLVGANKLGVLGIGKFNKRSGKGGTPQ